MTENNIPEEFVKVLKDFVGDLLITFPEYKPFIDKWWKTIDYFNYIDDINERNKEYENTQKQSSLILFEFCKKKLPPRFFDILYQNVEIFKEDSNVDTEFFPNIHFKNLWHFDISDKTRDTIWKYLQLMLFSIIGTLENKDAFGDTAKLFEAINEDDFKTKLQETLNQIQNLFDINSQDNMRENFNSNDLPNPEDINNHISGMLDGKLGKLATEIAEEVAGNLNIVFNDATDMKDILNKLMKNPTKLMELVKNVGNKLDAKIKSGELKESEMLQEATDLMNKMKNMPGMGNIQSMLNKMGMGGVKGKVNTSAVESQLNRKFKHAQMKERIRAKAQLNALKKQSMTNINQSNISNQNNKSTNLTDTELIKLFDGDIEKNKKENLNKKKKQKK
jgi:hypothetical protein